MEIEPMTTLKPIRKIVMTNSEIIRMINDELENVNWSSKDRLNGKRIDIFPEWESQMETIVWDYRKVGWKLFWFIEGTEQYLMFDCPWNVKGAKRVQN